MCGAAFFYFYFSTMGMASPTQDLFFFPPLFSSPLRQCEEKQGSPFPPPLFEEEMTREEKMQSGE